MLAPSISKPAPSAAAESAEPLATVINLSSILNSEVWISVAEPNTVKFPVTVILPVNEPVSNVTSEVVDKFWLIVSRFALLAWVWESVSKESKRESKDVDTEVPANKLVIWVEPLTTPSLLISKNVLYPLICADDETTESPLICKKSDSNCAEEEITPSPLISKNVDSSCAEDEITPSPLICKNSDSNCAEEDITESPFVFKYLVSNSVVSWDEPDITVSSFNLSFTLLSKFVIVLAFTCSEPLNTPSPLISKNVL